MKIGVLPHYSKIPANDFALEYPATELVGINLNQYGPQELQGSVPWAVGLSQQVLAAGRKTMWSVPFPGARKLEQVNDGTFDDLYISIAQQILAASPGTDKIYVRPPWEFNLAYNIENNFNDKNGVLNKTLGIRAWRRIAMIFRSISYRFKIVWSPSVERNNTVNPTEVWPGIPFVDVIAPDFYLCSAMGHTPGDYTGGWFRQPMLDLREFARLKGKPFGLSETGSDNDIFAADVRMWLNDVKTAPSGCEFIIWWNDWQVVDCRIIEGLLPAIALAFKESVAP